MTECCGQFSKYQIDMIEENLRLYDCMKASEKSFIQEVILSIGCLLCFNVSGFVYICNR